MRERLEKVASKAGLSASMRVELAVSEAKNSGAGGDFLSTEDREAERSRAEANLRQSLEEVRGISEPIYFRPMADRFAKALEQAAAAGVDAQTVAELKVEAVGLLREHKQRFEGAPKPDSGAVEYDVYNR